MNSIFKNWDAMRIIRLIGGLGLAVYGVLAQDNLLLILAGLLLLQALTNVSCCGVGGCASECRTSSKEVYKEQIETYKPNKK